MIGVDRRRVMGGGSSLPYDAEIEYLESTGTQWIDTLFYPRISEPDIRVENKFNKSVLQGNQCVLGARITSAMEKGFKLPNYYDDIFEYQGLSIGTLTGRFSIGIDYEFYASIKQGRQEFYVDDVLNTQTSWSGSCDAGGNLYLFALNQNGARWFFKGKIYYCKIWQDDVIERDFIPVRVGQVGYMYDKVSGQLFGNSGTENFILGPDINN